MARPRFDVTEAELKVLEQLWVRGPATIRLLTDALYPDGTTAHYATVQKLLERLMAKAAVSRTAQGRHHVYAAAIERDQLVSSRLRETADQLCGGSLTPLLTHLVQGGLSPAELSELRALLDAAATTPPARPGDKRGRR